MVIKSAKYYKNLDNTINYIKVTTDDNTIIHVPIHTANTDYIAIQKWVAEGNTIEEAD